MNKELVISEWRRARESLGAAATYEREGYYADSISRAYYAVMHAARAALQVYGVSVARHHTLGGLFGQYIVKRGLVEAPWSKKIGRLSNLRFDADYNVTQRFGEADARDAYQRAVAFLNRIRAFLTSRIPLDQLEPE